MELLLLIGLVVFATRPRTSSGVTVASGVNLAGAVGGGGAPAVDLGKLCTSLGLDATDCRLLKAGRVEELSERAITSLCHLAGLPEPCSTIGTELLHAVFGEPSWSPADKINQALNAPGDRDGRLGGKSCNSWRVGDGAGWSYSYSGTVLGGIRVYKSGCVPIKTCAGWSKCVPGTLPMDKWFAHARCEAC